MHHVIKVKPVVMTIIHIAEEEEGYLGTIQERKNCQDENMLLAYMQCRAVVHVILILK